MTKISDAATGTYIKPEFPGGNEGLQRFLSRNIHYPAAAGENNIQGTVLLSFLINEKGCPEDIRVLRPLAGGCTEEAIRVVSRMPLWQPAMYKHRPVKVLYQLPIQFRIED